MKTIFKSAILLMMLLLITVSISSCQKYEEGPIISFRTKNQRLSNIWKVENYKIDNKDYTSLIASYTETYSNQNAYNYSWGILNGKGSWAFQNNDKEIKLTGNDEQSNRTLTILKLEENSFWYTYKIDDELHELHLITQ